MEPKIVSENKNKFHSKTSSEIKAKDQLVRSPIKNIRNYPTKRLRATKLIDLPQNKKIHKSNNSRRAAEEKDSIHKPNSYESFKNNIRKTDEEKYKSLLYKDKSTTLSVKSEPNFDRKILKAKKAHSYKPEISVKTEPNFDTKVLKAKKAPSYKPEISAKTEPNFDRKILKAKKAHSYKPENSTSPISHHKSSLSSKNCAKEKYTDTFPKDKKCEKLSYKRKPEKSPDLKHGRIKKNEVKMLPYKNPNLPVHSSSKSRLNNSDQRTSLPQIRLTDSDIDASPIKKNKTDNQLIDNEMKIEISDTFDTQLENDYLTKQECVVCVDTNVLLDDTSVVDELRTTMFWGENMKIIIPYIVLQELDKLKHQSKTQMEAQMAIKWCNKYLEKHDPCIQGQSYEDYAITSEFQSKKGDDAIHACCLFYKPSGRVILLSNDVNLRNKALVSKIDCLSSKKLRKLMLDGKTDPKLSSSCKIHLNERPIENSYTNVYHETKAECLNINKTNANVTSTICSESSSTCSDIEKEIVSRLGGILEYAMKETFDELWRQIIIYKPPWTAIQVLKCFEKHWIAVFIDKFPSDVEYLIKKLRLCLANNQQSELYSLLSRLYKLFKDEPYRSIANGEKENTPKVLIPLENIGTISFPYSEKVRESLQNVGKHICVILNEASELKRVTKWPHLDANGNLSQHSKSLGLLRSTLVTFGFYLVSLKDGAEDLPGVSFKNHLMNYWKLAQRNVEVETFDDGHLKSFAASPDGQQFLLNCINDFEKCIQYIDTLGQS